MSQIIKARFDGNAFFPVKGINLIPDKYYTLIVKEIPTEMSSESAWDTLDKLKGTVDAPTDWSVEHDHYIYGTPKKYTSEM